MMSEEHDAVEELLRNGDSAKAKLKAAEWVTKSKQSGSQGEQAQALVTFGKARAANGEQDASLGTLKEALTLFKDSEDPAGQAWCLSAMANVHLDLDNTGEASDLAEQALKIYKIAGDTAGAGRMMHIQSMALRAEGDSIATLRMAEKASRLLIDGGDHYTEVESLILQAQMKLAVSQEFYKSAPVSSSVILMAKAAYVQAKQRRPGDSACAGEAGLTYAQALLATHANATAAKYAKEAAHEFRRARDQKKRGRALLIFASAEARGGDWRQALKICQQATSILDEADDEAGRGFSFQILDEVDASRRLALGLPTREEDERARQKELQDKRDREMEQQQQQMFMMAQMMQMQQGAGGKAPQQWKMPAQMPKQAAQPQQEAAPAGGGKVVVAREGSPLTVSAGMDAGVVRQKILDIATQIIGDEEGIDADMPLMQAGLTSNTAVLLRDELSRDLPGVNLPPTLMFDYPSIAAIADYVVEKAG